LRIEHADLDEIIDSTPAERRGDDLLLRRPKKRRLLLRDQIRRLVTELEPRGSA